MHKFFNTKLNPFSKKEEGFTIVELLVVIAIIVVLAAIALPFFLGNTAKAAKASVQSDVKNTNTSIMAYLASNPDATVEELETQAIVSNGNTITVSGSGYSFTICASSASNPDFTYGYDSSTGQYSEGCDNSNGDGFFGELYPYFQSFSINTDNTIPLTCGNTIYNMGIGTFTISSGQAFGLMQSQGYEDGVGIEETITFEITGYTSTGNACEYEIEGTNLSIPWLTSGGDGEEGGNIAYELHFMKDTDITDNEGNFVNNGTSSILSLSSANNILTLTDADGSNSDPRDRQITLALVLYSGGGNYNTITTTFGPVGFWEKQ